MQLSGKSKNRVTKAFGYLWSVVEPNLGNDLFSGQVIRSPVKVSARYHCFADCPSTISTKSWKPHPRVYQLQPLQIHSGTADSWKVRCPACSHEMDVRDLIIADDKFRRYFALQDTRLSFPISIVEAHLLSSAITWGLCFPLRKKHPSMPKIRINSRLGEVNEAVVNLLKKIKITGLPIHPCSVLQIPMDKIQGVPMPEHAAGDCYRLIVNGHTKLVPFISFTGASRKAQVPLRLAERNRVSREFWRIVSGCNLSRISGREKMDYLKAYLTIASIRSAGQSQKLRERLFVALAFGMPSSNISIDLGSEDVDQGRHDV